MKIIKLEKKKRLYLLELDNDQKLYITEDTIVKYFLSKDKEISEEELKEIQEFAQYSYGKNLALYHLSFKARTTKEVRDYLTKYEIDTEIIDKVVQHLKEEKWLDDRQYARNLIEAIKALSYYNKKFNKKGSQNLSFKKFLLTMILQKLLAVPQ